MQSELPMLISDSVGVVNICMPAFNEGLQSNASPANGHHGRLAIIAALGCPCSPKAAALVACAVGDDKALLNRRKVAENLFQILVGSATSVAHGEGAK